LVSLPWQWDFFCRTESIGGGWFDRLPGAGNEEHKRKDGAKYFYNDNHLDATSASVQHHPGLRNMRTHIAGWRSALAPG
jgi:hypothetical protein